MIRSFRHNGLRRFFEDGDRRAVPAERADRIRLILAHLNESRSPDGMALPGLQLHPLKGDRRGFWAVSVSGNWRIVFRFAGADAWDVDLVDYH